MHIAFLGLGAMGARMAPHLLDAGHDLTVWNRSPGPAEDLELLGAVVAHTPREAAHRADVVIVMVTDDEASRVVWTGPVGALAGLSPAAVAVESSTLTPGWVRELAALAAERGTPFLDAPVSGSTPQAEAASLVYLVGGDAEALETARPAFEAMGSAVHHVGPTGHGALAKLAVNAFMGVQVAAAAELLAALGRQGIDPATAAEIIGGTPAASPVATTAMRLMAADQHAPLFPVDLLEKDLRYALGMAAEAGVAAPVVGAARAAFRQAQAAGLGDHNMTAVSHLHDAS